MLSAKLARRARPPLGVYQPQGLISPFTSVVERMTSLSAFAGPFEAAPAMASQARTASRAVVSMRVANDFIGYASPGAAMTPASRSGRRGGKVRRVYGSPVA